MLHRGRVRFPWLNGGQWTQVPELTLGELLDCQARDVARLRALGVTRDAPDEHRERALEVADLALAADVLFARLCKADANLSRDRLDVVLNTRPAVLTVAAIVADADEASNPQWLPRETPLARAKKIIGALTGRTKQPSSKKPAPTSPEARSKEASTS